ncbi:MAG: transcriptional repressor [Alphaproteobacteria bacterium]|nr:transcriptional repressor [Alphaproteobacteria bacterium]
MAKAKKSVFSPCRACPTHAPNVLRHAQDLAAAQGQRWTEARESVYKALLAQGTPATAYALVDYLSARKRNKALKPMSVYRALEALTDLGLAVRIESLNAYTACQHPHHTHQHVFLICQNCGRAEEIADQSISHTLRQQAATYGFTPSKQVLELHGVCKDCI